MADPELSPGTVSVTGTSETPDTGVTMLAGATGARIPTGEHRRSGAMPTSDAPGTQHETLLTVAVVVAIVLVLAAIAFLLVSS